jgi:hypothetical protein
MRCSQSLPITLALGLTLSAESTRMIFAAAGPNADDVRSTILSFQTALGPLNGNPEGRHEINWNAADGPVRFDNLYNGSSALFPVFSAEKLFTLTGSNDYNVDFFMPATRSRSKVKGFGAVFANVSLPFTSSLEFFNADGLSLGMFYVPPAPRGLSFVGVMFTGRMVTRVRVVQGTVVPGAPEDLVSGQNAVVLDDFIYGEPVSDCIAN